MPNVTISIDEKILKTSREYAKKHGMSLNALIRRMLEQRVTRSGSEWLEECFETMDRLDVRSDGTSWSREDLYDV